MPSLGERGGEPTTGGRSEREEDEVVPLGA